MTAPPKRRSGPAVSGQAATTPPSDTADHTATADALAADKAAVAEVDASIWSAIYAGQFRLAVRCDICGRWLTAGRSKRAHRGPRCAAKVVAE